jgi:hypothetical protein
VVRRGGRCRVARVQNVPGGQRLQGCQPLLLGRVRDGGASGAACRGTRQAPHGALWNPNVN